MTEIGGFFASLKLKPDSASFAKGKKDLDDVAKSAKNLKQEYSTGADSIIDKTMKMGQAFMGLAGAVTKMTAGLSAAMVGMGVASAKSAEMIGTQSFKAGISPSMANRWRVAAQISGGSPDALMSEMAKVNQTFQQVDFGKAESYGELMKSLSFMGLTQEGLKGLAEKGKTGNVDALIREVLTWAGGNIGTEAQAQRTYQNVLDAFGPEIANFIAQAKTKGKSPMAFYEEAGQLSFRDAAGMSASTQAADRFNAIGASVDQVISMIGDDINKELLKYLTDITDWFKNNKEEIKNASKLISEAFGGILFALKSITESPLFQAFANIAGGAAAEVAKGLGGKEGIVRSGVDTLMYGFLRGEVDPRKTAYDIGVAFPGMFGSAQDIADKTQRGYFQQIEKGYASGQPFTLNINIDGKTQTYKIDPSKGTEQLINQGAAR